MLERAIALLVLLSVVLPASGAGLLLEPGALVAGGGPDQAVLVLLYVQSGHQEARSVYVVRPVARCRDPASPGWYALRTNHELRSAPELEGRQQLDTLDPAALPAACADPVPAPLPPARATAWARFVDGTLDPFGPVIFPPFGPPPAAQATDSGSPDDGVDRLVGESFRPFVAGPWSAGRPPPSPFPVAGSTNAYMGRFPNTSARFIMPEDAEGPVIRITKDGPYIVTGAVPLMNQQIVCDAEGESVAWREGESYPVGETYALCRCGGTGTPPFCDGTHTKIRFDGTETASRVPYLERADWIEGDDIRLSDAPGFCSHARFCVRGEGIWDLVERSDDPEARRTALEMAANCHSGRLVIWDTQSGEPIEPAFEPSIGVVEESDGRPGPLWVRGGIPVVSADGTVYEVRNRVTICRCGRSENKPFCDGSHQEP